jgi:hypothetical protein
MGHVASAAIAAVAIDLLWEVLWSVEYARTSGILVKLLSRVLATRTGLAG